MPRLTIHKSNFTAGEISPQLLGRGDLRAYENGAARLQNVVIQPTGGVTRRSGTRYIDTLPGEGRLVAFEFNTEQAYLMAFVHRAIHVYRNNSQVATISTPWDAAQLQQLDWVQSADTLLVCHPDVPPKKITRTSHTAWQISDWEFVEDGGRIFQPHHKFARPDVTLKPSATTGTVTLTASASVFQSGHVGTRFRISDKEVRITAVGNSNSATAKVEQTLAGTGATKDWEEQVFSSVRGYPIAVTFHQDRTVIGGSRALPNQFWMSKSADLFNFDLGEGLDDEAIEFSLLSDQVNAIRGVFSGRHLQVFTSGAEWMVTGDPLTPENVQIRRQTRIGSPVDRIVPPRNVDGATLFVPRNGRELREFLFTDLEQAYQASNLATLAEHLVRDPVDQDFESLGRHLHIIMSDGRLASLTLYRAEEVTGWSHAITQGAFRSISVVNDAVYFIIERDGDYLIELLDDDLEVDSGLTQSSGSAKTVWSGLEHLAGKTVKILADGAVRADATVSSGGSVTLVEPAKTVQVGLGFTHVVEPLPPAILGAQGSNQGGRLRLVSATFRLFETSALRLNAGRGFSLVPFKGFGGDVLDAPPKAFSGDKTVRAFGWRRDATEPLWQIEQDAPLPFTLLSVLTEVSANG